MARRLLDELDREETQGAIARLVASAVDGDLGLAVDVGAVYVTYGLVTTSLAAIVSRDGPRSAGAPRSGRCSAGRTTPQRRGTGIAALLGLPADDDDARRTPPAAA